MSHSEGFFYNGVWWFTDEPSTRFVGNLFRDSDNSLQLELIAENPPRNLYDVVSVEAILGNTIEGTHLTLFGCHRAGKQTTASGLAKITFNVDVAIEGLSQTSEIPVFQELLFDEMSFSYTGLEEWFEDQAMIFTPSVNTDEDATTVEVTYTNQKTDSIFIDEIQANVTYGYHVNRPESWTRNTSLVIEFNIHAFFKIHPSTPQNMTWFFLQSKRIRDFLSLCMRQPLTTIRADGVVMDQQYPVIVYPSQPIPIQRFRSSDTMLFAYKHISSDFGKMLKIWFEKTERLKVLVSLAFSVLYRGYRLPEFEFLALIQALEGYHKTDHPEPPKLPLRERLEKLGHICTSHDGELALFINLNERQLKLLVNTRNYLSHRQRKPNEEILEDERLSDAIDWMVNWINALIFIELDIPQSISLPDALRRGLLSGNRRLW